MKKQLFSIFLAVVMLCSSVSVALAAKKADNDVEADNNIAPWGAFDNQAHVDRAYPANMGGTLELETKLQKSGTGCLKANLNDGIFNDIYVNAPLTLGETYDISFDYRTDGSNQPLTVVFQSNAPGAGYVILPTGHTVTTQWNTYKTTFTNTGVFSSGTSKNGDGRIAFRYGATTLGGTFYIDNFSIVPHGDVEKNYLSLADKDNAWETAQLTDLPKNVGTVEFSDVANHWAKETVNTLATYGYIEGIGNNRFAPNENVTRAQFVKMVVETFHLEKKAYNATFSDIHGEEWYASFVSMANQMGLLDSALTFGNKFYPNQAITRAEAASISARAAKLKNAEIKNDNVAFSDTINIQNWAKESIRDAAGFGLICGYEDGTFRPKDNISRAEAAKILYRIVEITERFGIFVDSQIGDDKNEGTQESPLKTLVAARDMVRHYNKDMKNDLTVYIRGEQYLKEPLLLDNRDSGSNGYRVIYTSWGENRATLTGGKQFTGFKLHDAEKNIYKVYVGNGIHTRQAYFNNLKGIRSRTVSGFTNVELMGDEKSGYYYLSDDACLLDCAYPTEIEMSYVAHWRQNQAKIGSVSQESNGKTKVMLCENTWAVIRDALNKWSERKVNEVPICFENAYEFLDMEGEWYMNPHDGYMYYIPRKNENMETMVLTVPMAERLVDIVGESSSFPVSFITFRNLNFTDTTWLWLEEHGEYHADQNYVSDWGVPGDKATVADASVQVTYGWYVNFENNDFTRLGTIWALNLLDASHYCNVIGNEFYELSGGAVVLSDRGLIQRAKKPEDWIEHNRIENNYIHDVGHEYRGAAAVTVGYTRHTVVNHNEIANTPYSAIHIGWGWANYISTGDDAYDAELAYNYIEEGLNDRLYDGGAIYALGCQDDKYASVNKSRIFGNYFRAMRNYVSPLYLDEGSRYWNCYDNVIDQSDVPVQESNFDKAPIYPGTHYYSWTIVHGKKNSDNTLYNNYATTDDYIVSNPDANEIEPAHVYQDADWPQEAQNIITNAGVEEEYRDLFNFEGPKYLVVRQREYSVDMGKSVKVDMKVIGRGGTEYNPNDFDIKFYASDPDALEISDDGVMTAKKNTLTWVLVVARINGILQTKELKVWTGNGIVAFKPASENMAVIKGKPISLILKGLTGGGKEVDVAPEDIHATYVSADPSIATVDENGIVTGHQNGMAEIDVTIDYDGNIYELTVPIRIISYNREDSDTLEFTPVPDSFFDATKWESAVQEEDGSVTVGGSDGVIFWRGGGTILKNGLIAFDMKITNPHSWPSITMGEGEGFDYSRGSQYLIGFKSDHIEFQKFNLGVRTMFFGDKSFNPVGPAIPNVEGAKIFEYGKTYSIVIGMLEEDGGTRVVLTINGKNVFDYLDKDNNIRPGGLFGVYNTGGFTFSPYTGRTD